MIEVEGVNESHRAGRRPSVWAGDGAGHVEVGHPQAKMLGKGH